MPCEVDRKFFCGRSLTISEYRPGDACTAVSGLRKPVSRWFGRRDLLHDDPSLAQLNATAAAVGVSACVLAPGRRAQVAESLMSFRDVPVRL
jgi:hypothetical protein